MQESFVPGVAVKRMEGFRVALVDHRGPPDEIGFAFQRLFRLLRGHGLRPSGPMMVLRRQMPPSPASSIGDCAAVPVIGDSRGDSPLRFMDLPTCDLASLIYEGPPRRSAEGYDVLRRWMEDHGIVRAGLIREIYARDLSELPPGIVYMEIQVPVRKKRP